MLHISLLYARIGLDWVRMSQAVRLCMAVQCCTWIIPVWLCKAVQGCVCSENSSRNAVQGCAQAAYVSIKLNICIVRNRLCAVHVTWPQTEKSKENDYKLIYHFILQVLRPRKIKKNRIKSRKILKKIKECRYTSSKIFLIREMSVLLGKTIIKSKQCKQEKNQKIRRKISLDTSKAPQTHSKSPLWLLKSHTSQRILLRQYGG